MITPGSVLWLVLWQMKIHYRSGASLRRRWLVPVVYGGLFIGLHAIVGWLMALMLSRASDRLGNDLLVISATLLTLLFAFQLMAALAGSSRLLNARSELLPQLASPLPFARVLQAQVIVDVFRVWSISALFLLPIANMGLFFGRYSLLWLYPLTLALSVLAQALMLGLVAVLLAVFGSRGLRRAVPVAQLAVPVLMVGFNLWSQSDHRGANLDLQHLPEIMLLPARAAAGDLLALGVVITAAALTMALVLRGLGERFRQALIADDGAAGAPGRAASAAPLRFRAGLARALILKEWRTSLREPRLMLQIIVTPLWVVPLFYSRLFDARYTTSLAVFALVMIAAQLCQRFASLAISAEEAPALLAAAPQARSRLIAYKCAAAVLPALALLLLAALWIASRDLFSGVIALLCGAGATFSVCAIEVARPYPVARRSFVQVAARRRPRDPLDLLAMLMVELGWGGGAWCLAERKLWGAALVFLVIIVPFVQWWRDANRQNLLGY